MFCAKVKKQLTAIQEVVRRNGRGIHKRIDENRELMELLQTKASARVPMGGGVDSFAGPFSRRDRKGSGNPFTSSTALLLPPAMARNGTVHTTTTERYESCFS